MSEMTEVNTDSSTVVETVSEVAQTPALTVSVSAQDRSAELANAIPSKKVVEGKIRYYVKGVSCKKFGLEHDYKPVAGKRWAKCPRCNSTRTIKDAEPATPASESPTEVSA